MNRMADLHNKDADDLKKPVRTFLRLFIFYVDILDGNVLLSIVIFYVGLIFRSQTSEQNEYVNQLFLVISIVCSAIC